MRLRHSAIVWALLIGICVPALGYAAEIRTIPNSHVAGLGQEFSLFVQLIPEGESLNVIEGEVAIPAGIQVTSITTAGSALSLWPVAPAYVDASRIVQFTGGTPQGIPSDKKSLLFTIYMKTDTKGTYSFQPSVEGYAGDGTGRSVPLSQSAEGITIGDSSATGSSSPLVTSATELVAEIGADPSLFEGSWFLSVYGGDSGKGVSYYEIQEGNRNPVRTEHTYVLQDQARRSVIEVRAVAPDGSQVIAAVPARYTMPYGLLALTLCAVIVLVFIVWRFWRRRTI